MDTYSDNDADGYANRDSNDNTDPYTDTHAYDDTDGDAYRNAV